MTWRCIAPRTTVISAGNLPLFLSGSGGGGASLQQAQAMARHTDPKTTMIYFHNLDRIKAGAERFIQI